MRALNLYYWLISCGGINIALLTTVVSDSQVLNIVVLIPNSLELGILCRVATGENLT